MQVFSAFYAAVAFLTFAIQVLFSRLALERAGIAPTIGTLPASVVVGSVSAALIPGPWSVAVARGLEGILRGSLFRAGYELLYTPVPPAEKRATKTLVDIGCDRIGDIVGAGITALVLVAVPFTSTPTLLAVSALIAAATLWLVAHLQRGYVSSLEAGLRAGAMDLGGIQIGDRTTRTMLLRTIRGAGSKVFGPSTVRADAHSGRAGPRCRRPDRFRLGLCRARTSSRASLRRAGGRVGRPERGHSRSDAGSPRCSPPPRPRTPSTS